MRYLVEFDVIHPDTQVVETLYLTSGGSMPPFLPDDADRPNQYYDPKIQDLNGMSRSMFGRGRTYGKSDVKGGVITINNADGAYDKYFDYGYSGRSVAVYSADDDATTFSEYTPYFNGVIDTISFDYSTSSTGSLVLVVRSKKKLFQKDIQTNSYLGTNVGLTGDEGESDSAIVNMLKPLCFGKCYNVTPVLVNAAALRYQVHDGEINDIPKCYANGVQLTRSYSATPPAGHYYANLTTGIITLGTDPAGEAITCDVEGAKFSGVYKSSVSDLIYHILKTNNGSVDADLNLTSFASLQADNPASVGVYLSGIKSPDEGNQALTYITVFDKLVASIGAYWTFSRDNKFTVGRFDVPDNVTPVVSFDKFDIVDISLLKNADENKGVPLAKLTLKSQRNNTVQSSGLGGISVARAEWLRNEFRTAISVNSDNAVVYGADTAAMVRVSELSEAADSNAEVLRLMAIYETARLQFVVVLDNSLIPASLDVGSVITIVFNRFDMDIGRKFLITSMFSNYPNLNHVEVELYG